MRTPQPDLAVSISQTASCRTECLASEFFLREAAPADQFARWRKIEQFQFEAEDEPV
jgi:hypothetical protein